MKWAPTGRDKQLDLLAGRHDWADHRLHRPSFSVCIRLKELSLIRFCLSEISRGRQRKILANLFAILTNPPLYPAWQAYLEGMRALWNEAQAKGG